MAGMLNTLLDINQIEVGAVEPIVVNSPINNLLKQMREEFTYHAHARGLDLRVVESSLTVTTDPRLLEQMLRNMLSNALKYTEKGKVVLGCRRRAGVVSVEVWDSGIGIPKTELKTIFDEYYQIGNPAHQRSQGLGLGLSIVQRLASLLKHRIDVRSMPGRGSGFAIEIKHNPDQPASAGDVHMVADDVGEPDPGRRGALILIVEDDPEVRDLLEDFLVNEGHQAMMANDGPAAELLLARAAVQPDLLITDCNLPGGMNGIELAARVRARLDPAFPVIVLTGDISSATLRSIGQSNCVHFNKPVKIDDLSATIQKLLRRDRASNTRVKGGAPIAPSPSGPSMVYVVDDDRHVRDQVRAVIEDGGMTVADFATAEAFLAAFQPGDAEACLLIDAYLPGMSGVDALMQLRQARHRLPAIMMTGHSDVGIAVDAMKSGAIDFIEKPVARGELLEIVARALEMSRDNNKLLAWHTAAASQLADLTGRQRQIMDLVLAGHPSKNIAADLGISQRTVENHRAAIMARTGAKSLPELARLAIAASSTDAPEGVVK
jgi:two-component system CheB/CheR fusion protein